MTTGGAWLQYRRLTWLGASSEIEPLGKSEDKTTIEYAPDANRDPSSPHASLIVYHREGVRVVALERGEPVVVGRASPADVVVPEPSLSRQHAQFV